MTHHLIVAQALYYCIVAIVPTPQPRKPQTRNNMNGKGPGRKRLWPNLRYNAGIRLEVLRKTQKPVSLVGMKPRFEPGTSRIRIRSVNHSTTTFGFETMLIL
jgi:hypothetical protein